MDTSAPIDAKTLLQTTVERLCRHKDRYAELARHSGLSYSSICKLAQGHADNPTITSLQQIIEALDAFEADQPATEPVAAAR